MPAASAGSNFSAGALGSLAIVVLGLLAGTLVTLMADKRAGVAAAGAAWVVLIGGQIVGRPRRGRPSERPAGPDSIDFANESSSSPLLR